ncbi:hypothetical protein ScalyP_jg6191, partial [Parmales sp. scaly parma]
MNNGKKELMKTFLDCCPNKSKEQADRAVANAVRINRGIIDPKSTRKKFTPKERGEKTSENPVETKKKNAINNPINNPKNNPINNPIKAAKKRDALRDANTLWHNNHVAKPALTEDKLVDAVEHIINNVDIGGLGKLCDLQSNPNFTFYVGLTKLTLKDESLRWLTQRGNNTGTGRNRPVLIKGDGATIKMSEAIAAGFKSEIVFESGFIIDASAVEEILQASFHHLPLGLRKLWRFPGKGKSFDKEDGEVAQVYKVFVTYAVTCVAMIESGKWQIQPGSPSTPQSISLALRSFPQSRRERILSHLNIGGNEESEKADEVEAARVHPLPHRPPGPASVRAPPPGSGANLLSQGRVPAVDCYKGMSDRYETLVSHGGNASDGGDQNNLPDSGSNGNNANTNNVANFGEFGVMGMGGGAGAGGGPDAAANA